MTSAAMQISAPGPAPQSGTQVPFGASPAAVSDRCAKSCDSGIRSLASSRPFCGARGDAHTCKG